jgi:hypothetical protein
MPVSANEESVLRLLPWLQLCEASGENDMCAYTPVPYSWKIHVTPGNVPENLDILKTQALGIRKMISDQ